MPLTFVFIFILLALFYIYKNEVKKAKRYLSLGIIWLLLISYAPFSNYLLKSLETRYDSYLDIDPTVKYVLVLGNAHRTNVDISNISQLSNTALKRLTEGIRIYKKLDNAKLIVSGYAGDDEITPHAVMAKNAAISLGIPKKNILMQEKAKDTSEEANYAKQIIKNEKFILVTSASHMPRAMKIFESKGLRPIAAPAEYFHKNNESFLSFPRANELEKTTIAFHEYIGSFWFEIVSLYRFYLN